LLGRPLAPREEQPGDGERDGRAHPEEKLGQVLGVPGARPTNAAAAAITRVGHLMLSTSQEEQKPIESHEGDENPTLSVGHKKSILLRQER